MSVLEYQESDQSPKDLQQLNEDLREIEQRLEETANDAQPTESNQGSATQSSERSQEARAPPEGSQGKGSAADASAGANTSTSGSAGSDQGAAKTDPVVEKKPKKKVVPTSFKKKLMTRLMPKSFKTGTEFVADVYHGTDTDIPRSNKPCPSPVDISPLRPGK